jgi:chromosome partitioning protein
MDVVTLAAQKGGVGKTTLATNLAVLAEISGRRTLLVDLDPQGSATSWYSDRPTETPRLVAIRSHEVAQVVAKAKAASFDVVIIDTPGRDDAATSTAVRVANFSLVPCQCSAFDLRATLPTVNTITRLDRSFGLVVSQAPAPRGFGISSRAREVQAKLAVMGAVCPTVIGDRVVYKDAAAAGLAAMEFETDGKAADEIGSLWRWVEMQIAKAVTPVGPFARETF